ncbi:MAG: IclR family transcriptional regulator [Candidatus Bipolaricaulota bacterium]|nr:IclR family transcriptional regulator [Candidatus Bipolaricaulota bacterium]
MGPSKEVEKSDPSYINKSLDKALSILEIFDEDNYKLSVTELAQKYETNPSSLYPILHTLDKHGYLQRDGNKQYSLGLAFAEKSRLVLDRLNLSVEARQELKNLRDKTNKTVHLGYLNEDEVVYIDKVESKSGMRMYSSPGKTAPVHATALGKVILAHLSKQVREKILSKTDLYQKTKNTISSREKLEEELKKINKKGYAVDDGEFEEGIRCVASPIFRYDGKVEAAVSVTGLAVQMKKDDLDDLSLLVRSTAEEISTKLGFKSKKSLR